MRNRRGEENHPPVIISGMFRSGTSLLTRVLAADPQITNLFWEPLHPNLPENVKTYDFFSDYLGHPDVLDRWSDSFHKEHLYLKAGDRAPELQEYLSCILRDNVLSKTVRCQLRMDWIMERFDSLKVIHVIRDPRAVCYSYLKKGYNRNLFEKLMRFIPSLSPRFSVDTKNISLDIYETELYLNLLRKKDRWASYLNKLREAPPFIKILALWKIKFTVCREALQKVPSSKRIRVKYEDLCRKPEKTVQQIYRLQERPVPAAVKKNASGEETHQMGGHKKWQNHTTTKWIDEWKRKTNSNRWEKAIETAGLSEDLEHLGYYY